MSQKQTNVAILLATYNGSKHVAEQVRSLKENATPFTLHWLDDHSNDNTRNIVRETAVEINIELCTWHQSRHLGLPDAFFKLLECVEADIYLFCDQDDIWQPGKIDAAVANLLPDIARPVLCFSNSLMFKDGEPGKLSRIYKDNTLKMRIKRLIFNGSVGHAQGFTRPLRDIFMKHALIAKKYAFMHDVWMHMIAAASSSARLIEDVPVAFWRRHEDSYCAKFLGIQPDASGKWHGMQRWIGIQLVRHVLSQGAEGLIAVSETLPPGPKLNRALEMARLVMNLSRRHSLLGVIRIFRSSIIYLDKDWYNYGLWVISLLFFDSTHLKPMERLYTVRTRTEV